MRKNKKIFLFLILFILSCLLFLLSPQLIVPRMVDFEVNYKAGQRLLKGETLYRIEDGHYQFKYPPFASLLYLPLSYLSLTLAKFVWFFLTLLIITTIIFFSAQLASYPQNYPRYVPFFTFLTLARFFLRELSLGQINAWINLLLLIMVKGWLAAEKSFKKVVSIGFIWALTILLKPYSLIFFPLFILRGCWVIIFSSLIFLSLGFLTPALFYGWKGNLMVHGEWLKSLRASTPPLLFSQDNVSVFALLVKWFGPNFPVWTIGFLVIFFLSLVMFLMVLKSKDLPNPIILEAALLLLLIPLISPLGWDYTFLSASLAISLLLAKWSVFPRFDRYFLGCLLAGIGLMIYDLIGRNIYAFLMKFSLPTLLFLILLAHLVFLRWKKKA